MEKKVVDRMKIDREQQECTLTKSERGIKYLSVQHQLTDNLRQLKYDAYMKYECVNRFKVFYLVLFSVFMAGDYSCVCMCVI